MTTNPPSVAPSTGNEATPQPRIVKRYSNRKLYDTVESRYVTLPQIAVLVRNGEDVRIIDNNTKEDLTSVTLAQILYEEERKQSRALPLSALKDLIHTSGEKLSEFFREGPVGKMLRKDGDAPAEGAEAALVEPAVEPAVEAAKDSKEVAAKDGKDAAKDDKPQEPGKFEKLVEQSKASFAEWSAAVDERARKVFEGVYPATQLEKLTAEVKRLSQRVEELEAKLADKAKE
ncbi:MAG: polyhydroxyalkanoate synthesis regulator DNA-binding domain-containing protein [Polyangiales bacterium]